MDFDGLHNKAVQLRCDVLEMTHRAGEGYVGSALSCVDILMSLYYGGMMSFDPQKPGWDGQDYCVLSKGEAVASLYAILADCGFFEKDELKHFRKINASLQGFPFYKTPGVSVTTGGAGQGVSQAVGLALALKKQKKKNRVFVVVDGCELQRGDVWEAAMLASHYLLDNIVMLVDWSGLHQDGSSRTVMNIEPIVDKFVGFGWKTSKVHDGHDFGRLLPAVEKAIGVTRRPAMIFCKTVKGKGVPFVENKTYYHRAVLSDAEMKEAIPFLQSQRIETQVND